MPAEAGPQYQQESSSVTGMDVEAGSSILKMLSTHVSFSLDLESVACLLLGVLTGLGLALPPIGPLLELSAPPMVFVFAFPSDLKLSRSPFQGLLTQKKKISV